MYAKIYYRYINESCKFVKISRKNLRIRMLFICIYRIMYFLIFLFNNLHKLNQALLAINQALACDMCIKKNDTIYYTHSNLVILYNCIQYLFALSANETDAIQIERQTAHHGGDQIFEVINSRIEFHGCSVRYPTTIKPAIFVLCFTGFSI